MRILAFLGLSGNHEPHRFLLEAYPDDMYRFVVAPGFDERELRRIREYGAVVAVNDAQTIDELEREPETSYDWLLSLWSPYLIPPSVIARARRSLVVHNSLVPFARGRDAVSWTIRERVPAGASAIEVDAGVDTGRIWHQREVPYTYPIRASELAAGVERACLDVFFEQWPILRVSVEPPVPQAGVGSVHRRSDTLRDKLIDTEADLAADLVINKLLAHDVSENQAALVRIGGKLYRARLVLEGPIDA